MVNRCNPDTRQSETMFYRPPESRYCYTSHTMDNNGESTSVTKRCAALQDCLSTGCTSINDSGHQVGVSSQVSERHAFDCPPNSVLLRCARPAVRGTSATCWCRKTRAAPFSPPRLLWRARAEGLTSPHCATALSPCSSSLQEVGERASED